MGRRRSGRRRAAVVDSPADLSGRSTADQQKSSSSSGGSTVTSLSQQTVEESPPPQLRPPQDTAALRRRLLGLIRGFYLDAISRLPTADLRATTLARGLLLGGHCFGPLHPVHNIITNSVWYAAAFPLHPADRTTEVGVLTSQAIDRAARRSLDGLLAYLLRVHSSLSPADALWQLSRSRADLRAAFTSVRCAKPSLPGAADPEVVKAAFQAAAEAAPHPNPAAFAHFVSSVLPNVERDVSCLLVSKGGLSSLDIDRLSTMLLPYPLPDELLSSRPDPSPKVSKAISVNKRNATNWQKCVLAMADAALCKFTRQTGLHYELHTVYCESFLDDERHNKHFHINFIAQPKEDHTSSLGVPSGHRLFFFAEAPLPPLQNFREEGISMCCLVEPSPGYTDNCHACLRHERKISHPVVGPVYHSHILHFGEQCSEIDTLHHDWDFRPILGVDYLCFDSDRDNGLVEHLRDYFARIDAYCSYQSDDEK
ncbi:unnamed protein product [Urochloa humidicola]